MPEHAAYLLNRLKTGEDGAAPYERAKGKKPSVMGVEFGEKLLYMKKMGDKLQKIRPRWSFGIFVGVRRLSNEIMVATPKGITHAQRIPYEKMWSMDCLSWVCWAPWRRYAGQEDEDGEVPEGVPALERDSGERKGYGEEKKGTK